MLYYADAQKLSDWCEEATFVDTTWFRPRKELWDKLKLIISAARRSETIPDGSVTITAAEYNSLKSALLARADKFNAQDQLSLAFETAVQELSDKCDDELPEPDDNQGKAEQG